MDNARIETAIPAVRGEEHTKPSPGSVRRTVLLLSSAVADKTARHYLRTRGHERYCDFSTPQAFYLQIPHFRSGAEGIRTPDLRRAKRPDESATSSGCWSLLSGSSAAGEVEGGVTMVKSLHAASMKKPLL